MAEISSRKGIAKVPIESRASGVLCFCEVVEIPFLQSTIEKLLSVLILEERTPNAPCPHVSKANNRFTFVSPAFHRAERDTACAERIGEFLCLVFVYAVHINIRSILSVGC